MLALEKLETPPIWLARCHMIIRPIAVFSRTFSGKQEILSCVSVHYVTHSHYIRKEFGMVHRATTSEQGALEILLPHQTTILHQEKRTLIAIHSLDGRTVVGNFSANEWVAFLLLLQTFPYYTSFEALLASVTTLPLETARSRLLAADTDRKRWEQEFRPVSRALTTLRKKLKPFSLQLALARHLGYSITAAQDRAGHGKSPLSSAPSASLLEPKREPYMLPDFPPASSPHFSLTGMDYTGTYSLSLSQKMEHSFGCDFLTSRLVGTLCWRIPIFRLCRSILESGKMIWQCFQMDVKRNQSSTNLKGGMNAACKVRLVFTGNDILSRFWSREPLRLFL